MFKNIDWLYTENIQGGETIYTSQPTDKIEVSQIPVSPKIFIEEHFDTKKHKKKSIIFCDWSCRQQTEYRCHEKIFIVKKLLEELLEDKFTIILPTNTCPTGIFLEKNHLESELDNFLEDIKPITFSKNSPEVALLIKAHNIPIEELVFLDYFRVNKLLLDRGFLRNYEEGELALSDILVSNLDKNIIFTQLKDGHLPPTLLVNSDKIHYENDKVQTIFGELHSFIPETKIKIEMTPKIDCQANIGKKIDTSYAGFITSLKINEILSDSLVLLLESFASPQLMLTELEISPITRINYSIEIPTLLELLPFLSHSPTLKKLTLTILRTALTGADPEMVRKWIKNHPDTLKNITEFSLQSDERRSDRKLASNVEILLNQMPNLEIITLRRCNVFTNNFKITSLKKIKTITLAGINDSKEETLQEFLAQILALENLTLNSLHIIKLFTSEWCNAHPTAFQQLKSLQFNNVEIEVDELQNLLLMSPNLEKLEIKSTPMYSLNTVFTEEYIKLHPQTFRKIKSLSIDRITPLILRSILAQAISLESLTLAGVPSQMDKDWHAIPSYSLTKLKELIFVTEVDFEIIRYLIAQTPALECLKLPTNNSDLNLLFNQEFLEKHARKLQYLKKLTLSKPNKTKSVQRLLSFLPALEEIEFLFDRNMEKIFGYHWLNTNPEILQKLKKISTQDFTYYLHYTTSTKDRDLKRIPNNFSKVKDRRLPTHNHNSAPSFIPLQRPITSFSDPSPKEDEFLLDAHTAPNDASFNLKRIFFAKEGAHPDVSEYRLKTYRALHLNPKEVPPEQAFTVNNKENEAELDLLLRETHFKKSQEDLAQQWYKDTASDVVYAKLPLEIGPIPQPLPSLSAHETLLSFHCSDPTVDYYIYYSQRDNLHYISSKNNTTHSVVVDYLLKQPAASSLKKRGEELQKNKDNTFRRLSSLIQEILQEAGSYLADGKEEKLSLSRGTGEAYINAIMKEKKGVCRHFAAAFMYYLKEKKEAFKNSLPEDEQSDIDTLFDFRMVVSGCHAWVEIAIDGEWFSCDLGGAFAQLTVDESNQPKNTVSPPAKREPLSPTQQTSPLPSPPPLTANTKTTQAPSPLQRKYNFSSLFTETKEALHFSTVEAYCHHLFRLKEKSLLIDFDTKASIKPFIPLLTEYSHQETNYALYYIDTAEDLSYASLFFSAENKEGVITGALKKGRGGPLHDFLTQPGEKTKVLLINWANFKRAEIIQYNSLLDVPPLLHSEEIKGVKLLGLYNKNHPEAYQGNDFFDRFDGHTHCDFSEVDLIEAKEKLPSVVMREGEGELIELYHAPEWKSLLLGQWQLEGEVFKYKAGPLLKGIQEGRKHFRINHGPWENSSFERFWQKIRLDGYISIDGYTLALPPDFHIIRANLPYAWDSLAAPHRFVKTILAQSNERMVLNPHSFSYFFGFYTYLDSNTKIYSQKGLLETFSHQTLSLRLTRELTPHQWSRLLEEANRFKVCLDIEYAQALKLPVELSQRAQEHLTESPCPSPHLIISTDRDYTVAQLCQKMPEAWVVDASELSSTDVLSSLTCTAKEEIKFTYQVSDIWHALTQNKTVILSGNFSDELLDHLASLCQSPGYAMINGKKEGFGGRLLLVTEEAHPGKGLAFEEEHFPSDTSFIKNKTLARFKALSLDPWEGMLTHRGLEDGREDEGIEEDELFCLTLDKKRLRQVEALWEYSPYAFLAGKTGVGKTAFVKEILAKAGEYSVYYEEEELLSWLSDKRPEKKKILFIDEANISTSQWSGYEGLFQTPPFLLVGGKRQEVSPSHKVLFAGNPLSYGGERHLPSLFERHGGSTVFSPLPGRYIAHRILSPLLAYLPTSVSQKAIKEVFMPLYTYILGLSDQRVLITPRELEMMALLMIAYWKENLSVKEEEELIAYSAYRISASVIPEEKLADFTAYFKNLLTLEGVCPEDWEGRFPRKDLPPLRCKEFVITRSRKGPYQQLEDFLAVRLAKQKSLHALHQKGGLGGVILEGEPGEGKSYFVIEMLEAKGFKRVDLDKAPQDSNSYYHLPPALSPKQKEACLLKAYAAGAVVVMDEVNSSSMMERLLNDMLMGGAVRGITPTPGFLLIGTQNSIARAGRKATSQALQRRMMQVNVPSYPPEELEEILTEKFGLEEDLAQNLLSDYLTVLHSSTEIPPTPRKLFRIAEKIKSHQKPPENKKKPQQDVPKEKIDNKIPIKKELPNPKEKENEKKPSSFFPILFTLLGIGIGIFLGNIIMPGVGMLMGGVLGGLVMGGFSVSIRYFITQKEEKPQKIGVDDPLLKESYKNILNQAPPGADRNQELTENHSVTSPTLPSVNQNDQTKKTSFNQKIF